MIKSPRCASTTSIVTLPATTIINELSQVGQELRFSCPRVHDRLIPISDHLFRNLSSGPTLLGPLEGLNISESHPTIQCEVPVQGVFSNAHWGLPQVLTCGLGTGPTIDVLPEDTLLDIFDFDRILESDYSKWRWDRLVHVCRRWRQIIFASPLSLRLQLRCTRSTPVGKYLGVWPPFPLASDYDLSKGRAPNHEDNLLAALEDTDRVGLLYLCIKRPHQQMITLLNVT